MPKQCGHRVLVIGYEHLSPQNFPAAPQEAPSCFSAHSVPGSDSGILFKGPVVAGSHFKGHLTQCFSPQVGVHEQVME